MKTDALVLLKSGLWVEYISLAWMTIECVVSIYSGLIVRSLALLAFGGDSVIELLSSLAVVQHLRDTTRAPTPGTHDDRRTEWVTAMLLISLIPIIGLGTIYSILTGIRPEASLLGIGVASFAVVIMPILWYQKKRIGKLCNCLPLEIDASESATCFLMSIALLGGLVINYSFRLPWIDYVVTLIILIFVAREATDSIREVSAKRH
ncbi:MAG: cation transporter [Candidatus Bathyarchaeia archaeon]